MTTHAELERMLRTAVREVPDFPRPGISFKDVTPVLADASMFGRVSEAMAEPYARDGVTHVAGIESRGFIFGAAVAARLHVGFLPVRKPGRLPRRTARAEYVLEYGVDCLEVHLDAAGPGDRVLIVDDVLATGGTARAACGLIESLGAEVVGCSFLLALSFLPGMSTLEHRRASSLLVY